MAPRRSDELGWLPWSVWVGGAIPGVMLAVRAWRGELGADPVALVLNACGDLAIKCLLLCLACTPLRILTRRTWPMRVRKHLGLLAFVYAALHLGVYVGVDRAGELATLIEDVTQRPFIMVGMSAFLLLLPLAATSSQAAVKKLGGRAWARLHKLVYAVAVLAVLHFVLRAKKDATVALMHGGVLALLLAVRVVDRVRARARAAV